MNLIESWMLFTADVPIVCYLICSKPWWMVRLLFEASKKRNVNFLNFGCFCCRFEPLLSLSAGSVLQVYFAAFWFIFFVSRLVNVASY